MPLFQFQCLGDCTFTFGKGQLSIRRFDPNREIPPIDLFSGQDIATMHQAEWALIANSAERSQEGTVSLLILAFRILATDLSPMIKFRLSQELEKCTRIHEELARIRPESRLYEVYSQKKLTEVDQVFSRLFEADQLSPRLHNAYYFLYRATHTIHWIDSFVFYMSTLEALFGAEKGEPVTKTIHQRCLPRFMKGAPEWFMEICLQMIIPKTISIACRVLRTLRLHVC